MPDTTFPVHLAGVAKNRVRKAAPTMPAGAVPPLKSVSCPAGVFARQAHRVFLSMARSVGGRCGPGNRELCVLTGDRLAHKEGRICAADLTSPLLRPPHAQPESQPVPLSVSIT